MGSFDVAVVGGGMGGLAVAALVARTGRTVCVLERARTTGGRAATHVQEGFRFNLGAHALYRGGAAERVLGTLGARVSGHPPPLAGALAVYRGESHGLPTGALSLALTGLLPARAKLEAAVWLSRLGTLDTSKLARTPVAAWLDEEVRDPVLRAMLEALFRLTSYTNAPGRMSAGAALAQLAFSSSQGVVYVDGGWQGLVDSLLDAARRSGADVRTSATVIGAERRADGWSVRCEEGADVHCRTLVVAAGPRTAASIVDSKVLDSWAADAAPVKAACLDVALESLPRPTTCLAIGIDRPLYYSVHSVAANLAPAGAALVSTIKYLQEGEPADPERDRAELEAWLDRLQPGWRDRVVVRRYLPGLVVSSSLARADRGGLAGRPGPLVPDAKDLLVVGDWVGGEGMLLDAVLASAEAASRAITEHVSLATVA